VQRVDGHAGALEAARQLEGEEHLRELALPVRAAAGVGALEHHVLEVDGRR
jgi:hypothetical protein